MDYKLKSILIFSLIVITGCATIAGLDEEEGPPGPFAGYSYEREIDGQPRVDFRIEGGIYYWKRGDTWHIRFARPRVSPRPVPEGTVFSGSIKVEDGILIDVRRQNTSPFNEVKRFGDTLSFRFEIKEAVEGFDFTIQPLLSRYCVITDLRVNGIYMPELVHLGEFMHRPDSIPFRICVRRSE